jgi:4-carboxymuconolactone decarboxylase
MPRGVGAGWKRKASGQGADGGLTEPGVLPPGACASLRQDREAAQESSMAAPPSARRDRINPAFPKLVEMTNQYVYGDVWERKQLSKRDRSMVTIAALVALGWQDQLNSHIGRGLTNGLTREEVSEIITHLAMYSGWPSAMTAAHVAVDVFEAQDKAKG